MKKNKHVLTALLALVIVAATLFFPSLVHNVDELKEVKSGFPLPFLTSDCSQYDPPFPYKFTALCGAWGETNIIEFSWLNFTLSYLIIFSIAELVAVGIKMLLSS